LRNLARCNTDGRHQRIHSEPGRRDHRHHSSKFVPYLTALGLLFSLQPVGADSGLESRPCADRAAGLRAADWFYYTTRHRENGVGYVKHFIGPQEGMPLMVRVLLPFLLFPIEIFSHLARVLSLTVRLFANMFAEKW